MENNELRLTRQGESLFVARDAGLVTYIFNTGADGRTSLRAYAGSDYDDDGSMDGRQVASLNMANLKNGHAMALMLRDSMSAPPRERYEIWQGEARDCYDSERGVPFVARTAAGPGNLWFDVAEYPVAGPQDPGARICAYREMEDGDDIVVEGLIWDMQVAKAFVDAVAERGRELIVHPTGLNDSEIVLLWDAGARMTMPGSNPDFYLDMSRETVEQLLGRLEDGVIHPEQEKPGWLRLRRVDGSL